MNNTWNNKHSFKWKLFKRYIYVVLSVKINICHRHNVCDQRIKFLWQTDRLRSKFGSCKRQYRMVSSNKYWLQNIRCWAWTSFVFVYKSFFFPLPGFFRNQFSVVFLDIFNNPLRIVVAAIKWGFLGDWNAYIVFALVSEGQTGQIDVKSDRSWMLTWVADFN